MDDHGKTKEQLIHEMVEIRHRLGTLEEMDTGRKQAEEALRASEERYRTLAESSPDCIKLLDLEGTIIECNTVAVQCFEQKSKEDFIGKKLIPFFPEEYQPDLVEALDGVRQGQEACLQLQTRATTGALMYWDITINPIRDEADQVISILFAGRDITERVRAEEALGVAHKEAEKAGEYLETLIEDSLDAIISTDKEGMVVLFNKGAEVLLGYRREEVFGQRVTLLYESEERAKEVMRRMREEGGAVSAFETILRAKDGSQIPVLISASILYDEEGEEVGTVGFNKDLRERKRSEEELRERHEELKQSYDALERAQASIVAAEKLAALGRLTAGVSHEILNPLTIITMSLQLMTSDPETPPEIARQLRVLDEQAHRINKITQELLYFARQREPERLLLDFNDTLQRTLGLLARDLHLQNIAVELTLAEGLPPLLADQDQLQQVILNLLTNARDAMPKGGRLSLSTKSVQTNGQKFVELRVEDTGEGIAPEHLENLFDPFFTTKPVGEGTGLGLSICQGIVEAHGGSIRAENLPEGGAAFVVRLGMEEG